MKDTCVNLQIEQYYNLTYTIVSLIFLSPFVGYTASALMNNYLHKSVGQRGVGGIASVCHLLAYIIVSFNCLFVWVGNVSTRRKQHQ